jgi:DNA-binding NtrC family response regulator
MGQRKGPAFIGISPAIRQVILEIGWAARTDAKVLITGESGVGKEIAARLVHEQSRRATLPLVTINCAGIPDSLLESELFGHVRGSFTGAHRDRSGLLELAQGGSVFLDEVGEMSLRLQAALLRFLETGEIQRVGADSIQSRVDVRVIAATNRDLLGRIVGHGFREDLYYRLNVVNIAIPPLRERREDIPALLRHFFLQYAEDHGVAPLTLAPEALTRLVAYDWPGNVRQLRNLAERMIVRAQSSNVTVADLPPEINLTHRRTAEPALQVERPVADVLFDRMVQGGESFWMVPFTMFMARDITRRDMREIIEKGLRATGGNYKELPALFNIPADDYKRLLNFFRQHKCHIPFQQFRRAGRTERTPPAESAADNP